MVIYRTAREKQKVFQHGLFSDHSHYEYMSRPRPIESKPLPFPWEERRNSTRLTADLGLGNGLHIRVYTPLSNAVKPAVIAFGGTFAERTVSGLLSDLTADFDILGIGAYRYLYNEGSLKKLLTKLNSQYPTGVVLVGHSLGGTLAQMMASRMANKIQGIVTFQAPKIEGTFAANFSQTFPVDIINYIQNNCYHYQVDGDFIHEGGEELLTGVLIKYKFAEDTDSTDTHVKKIFSNGGPTRRVSSFHSIETGVIDTSIQSTTNYIEDLRRLTGALTRISLGTAFSGQVSPIAMLREFLQLPIWYSLEWYVQTNGFNHDNLPMIRSVPPLLLLNYPVSRFFNDEQRRNYSRQWIKYTQEHFE